MKRRWLLVAACSSLLATLATRGHADTELEAAGYAGQSTGFWTCGPRGQARYGGLAGQLRYSDRRATRRHGRGGTMIVGGSLEYEHVRVDPSVEPQHAPLRSIQGGLGLRGGYDFRYFGAQLGLLTWSAWGSYGDRKPTGYVVPQLEFRGGPQDLFWFSAGFGSPLATTYRRPGAYLGANLKLEQHELNACLGRFRAGPAGFDDLNTRFDLVWKFPVWGGWGPRVGGSLSEPASAGGPDWEASLGVVGAL